MSSMDCLGIPIKPIDLSVAGGDFGGVDEVGRLDEVELGEWWDENSISDSFDEHVCC